MRLSHDWLGDFLDLEGVSPEHAAELLTLSGTEVERLIPIGHGLEEVVVAELVGLERLERSDHLWLARVEAGQAGGGEVVCGAQNLVLGARVPWARPGSRLPDGSAIAERRIRGQLSQGMLCSPLELGLGADHDGILLLEEGEAQPGEPLSLTFPQDTIYELEIQSNRGDCLCHLGVARELAAMLGRIAREPELGPVRRAPGPAPEPQVAIQDQGGCSLYTAQALEVEGARASPTWMRRRLLAVGARPISPIVDLANYVMLEVGQPVHTFDRDRLGAGAPLLGVRRARSGEALDCLDGQRRRLEPSDLVITAADEPAALAGLIGGSGTAVGAQTTRVVLESANFDRVGIRRSSRRLGLRTEASSRFERGLSPALVELGRERFCRLAQEVLRARVGPGPVVAGASPEPAAPILTSGERISRLLGLPVTAERAAEALRRLCFSVRVDGDGLAARPDPVRTDVTLPEDLTEEVGRVLGYQQLPETLPALREPPSGHPGRAPAARLAQEIALGAGFTEAVTLSLVPVGSAPELPSLLEQGSSPRLSNPLSLQLGQLRTSCLPGLLRSCQVNQARGRERVRLFELGHCFWPVPPGERPLEPELLALADSQVAEAGSGGGNRLEELLRLVQGLGERLGPGAPQLLPAQRPGFRAGHCVEVLVNGERRGVAGELSAGSSVALGLRGQTVAAELRLDGWLSDGGRPGEGRRLSKQPALVVDLAVTVPDRAQLGPALGALAEAGVEDLEA
ncbi:MAG: phenylalanine--tRNA ligase subunit beta, partial [Candidatus Dormibacteria bacterium]